MLFLIFLLLGYYCALVGCVNDEGLALLSFRESVYQQGSLDNWNSSDTNPCAWTGIRCMEDKVVLISFPNHNLSGFLSPALGKLSSLRHINLRNNMFSGSLPAELFDARGLQSLYLSGNLFSGTLPPEMGRLSSLQKLDLSQNSFSGSITASIQQCKKLKVLVLSHNNFTGSIPDGLGTSLVSLTKLDFSFNRLSGSIPDDMGSLSSLQGALNLSHNLLTGPIPESLANLPLKLYIDLSYNNLTGKIPQKGALLSVGPTAFLENPLLCGPPSKTACSGDSDSQSVLHNPSRNIKHNKGRAGLATAVAVATVGICLVGILFSYWYRKAYASSSSNEGKLAYGCNFEDALMIRKELFCFTKSDMETLSENREQCEFVPLDSQVNFSLDQLLKASAFLLRKSGIGIVYKVVLEDGRTVAVRRIGDGSSQRFKEFQTEVEAIGKIRHPNIVTLRAYCWSLHEKLLIYDYIPNGDLATAIHGKAGTVSSKPPSWPVRLRIMKGIARGLAYLHDHSTKKYIHGDLKPSNILLGNDMKPHISDFGLSRLAEPQLVQTPQQSSPYMLPATSSADTYYQAPEASRLAKPSQKWDVYSYGVIVLEMISRKSPLLQMRSPGSDLVGWIQFGVEKGKPLRDLLDPCLAYDLNKQEIIVALQLGLACVHDCPERRPSMKHVSNQLDKLGTCTDRPQQSRTIFSR